MPDPPTVKFDSNNRNQIEATGTILKMTGDTTELNSTSPRRKYSPIDAHASTQHNIANANDKSTLIHCWIELKRYFVSVKPSKNFPMMKKAIGPNITVNEPSIICAF